jgi:hypothetical protein
LDAELRAACGGAQQMDVVERTAEKFDAVAG